MESIVVEAGNAKYDSRNNCNAIIETASNTLVGGCRNTNIPATVQKIGNEAFYGIYLGFDQPVEISIPEGVTEIGSATFAECTSIQKISLPSTLEKIGTEAFLNCEVLTEIICCNDNPPTIEKGTDDEEDENEYEVFNTFDCVPEDAILIVPVGSAEKYAKAEGWDRFNGYINEDDTLTGVESVIIDENAPIEYYNLQGVKLDRPENGIFIKKQGSKATKVIINK